MESIYRFPGSFEMKFVYVGGYVVELQKKVIRRPKVPQRFHNHGEVGGALLGTFNQEKALIGAFSVCNLREPSDNLRLEL